MAAGIFKSIGHFLGKTPIIGDWIEHPSHLPVVGSIFGQTPEQENLTKQIANLQGLYAAYKPQIEGAQMQGLSQQLGAFAPVNTMLGRANGMGNQPFFNTGQLAQNPMVPTDQRPAAVTNAAKTMVNNLFPGKK